MAYILFTTLEQAEAYQAESDVLLGYPEKFENFCFEGAPNHASWELGRAMHYAPIEVCQFGTRYALPKADAIDTPQGGTELESLPEDWYAPTPELG